jgi:hypothetical protein
VRGKLWYFNSKVNLLTKEIHNQFIIPSIFHGNRFAVMENRRFCIYIAFLILSTSQLSGQLFFNQENEGVFITSGAIIYIEGGVQFSDGGSGDAWFDNEGIIQVGSNLAPSIGAADWVNNNLSDDGMVDDKIGIVEFVSGIQDIAGITVSRFNKLSFTSASSEFDVLTDIIVDSVLDLGIANELDLNSTTLTLTNSSTTAINSSSGGYIRSETNPISDTDYSTVVWDVTGGTGAYVIPFHSGSEMIPISITLLSLGASPISFSTYPSAIDNTDYPPIGTGITDPVTSMYSAVWGGDNSENTIDRFWIVDLGLNSSIDLSFSYGNDDVSSGVIGSEALLFAQNWSAGGWHSGIGTSFGPAIPMVNAIIANSGAWTLSRTDVPLPITCLGFSGVHISDYVELRWAATNEEEIRGYYIDRSLDLTSWEELEFISVGENEVLNDYSWKELVIDRLEEGYYYRLRQIDFDGKEEFSCELIYVPLYFETSNISDITLYPNPTKGIIRLALNWDKGEVVLIDVYNSQGQHLCQTEAKLSEGLNALEFDFSNHSVGSYLFQINTNERLVTRKFQLL